MGHTSSCDRLQELPVFHAVPGLHVSGLPLLDGRVVRTPHGNRLQQPGLLLSRLPSLQPLFAPQPLTFLSPLLSALPSLARSSARSIAGPSFSPACWASALRCRCF